MNTRQGKWPFSPNPFHVYSSNTLWGHFSVNAVTLAQVPASRGAGVAYSWRRCGNRVGTCATPTRKRPIRGAGPQGKTTPAPKTVDTCARVPALRQAQGPAHSFRENPAKQPHGDGHSVRCVEGHGERTPGIRPSVHGDTVSTHLQWVSMCGYLAESGAARSAGGWNSMLHKNSPADAELFLWSIGDSNP